METIDDYLAFAYLLSSAAIAVVCVAMRIRFGRLFDPKPGRSLRVLMIAAVTVPLRWSVAVTLRIPLPHESSIRQASISLFLVYLWAQTIQAVRKNRQEDARESHQIGI